MGIGTEAPRFELPDLANLRRSLQQYRGNPSLVIFFNPACRFCRDLLPKLAAASPSPPQEERDGERRSFISKPHILIISTGNAEANRTLFEQHKVSCPVLLQNESDVAATYQANGTPSGYLISADGKIATGLAMGGDALLRLLDEERRMEKEEILTPALAFEGGEGEESRANRFSNRSLARSKLKRDGLKAGTPAPDFRAVTRVITPSRSCRSGPKAPTKG